MSRIMDLPKENINQELSWYSGEQQQFKIFPIPIVFVTLPILQPAFIGDLEKIHMNIKIILPAFFNCPIPRQTLYFFNPLE